MRLLNEFETNLPVSFGKFYFYHTRGINIIDAKEAVSINIFDIVPGNCRIEF